ncbi:cytochrome oxidase putative small subunit CydP [Azospirillum sp. B4]|uniref:cytochrome oxidase putative small subunit CydP n=1 Tax=Azospirillum sp. B4 TaxID=95605 RepID=UPI000345B024|nr:cytochrome oxidase putative small subunit CydP [Azospirillum sp. B4]
MAHGTAPPLTGRLLLKRVLMFTALKLVLLCALFFLFFSPAHRPKVTPSAVGSALFAAPAAAPKDEGL